ncbi:hypothetical protein LXA43DRAFT_879098 [Ganoderma leucocontextum]|nr:hypothetical protein LXA43DRAFT_879098 [Ganoderma leucocontextum]
MSSTSSVQQSNAASKPAAKAKPTGKGKAPRKGKALEQRKSVPWKSDPALLSLLKSKLPQYQVYLAGNNTSKKRQWMEEIEGEVVSACPQAWVDHWGTDHLKKSCRDWFNNNRTLEQANASTENHDSQAAASDTPAPKRKVVATTSKSVLGKVEDNPLAKALRTRKLSPMRLWGSAHNELVQKRIAETRVSKVGGWSGCAAWLWQNTLTEGERAEWTERAGNITVSDEQQCFQNQLGVSSLLAGLLTGLIGTNPTQIGKACFSIRLAYRTADGQLVFEDMSLAEDQETDNFIPFAHYGGGNPPEEDERWMQWANQFVGKGLLVPARKFV